MYTLMDIEWIELEDQTRHPTQIAAMRVDKDWQCQDVFYTRIQPEDPQFHIWEHVAYTGGYANEFLSAPPLAEVCRQLNRWLKPDDTLCWWRDPSDEVFHSFFPQVENSRLILFPHISSYLHYSPYLIGSEYHIVSKFGIRQSVKRHFASDDVSTMRLALYLIKFPQELLEIPIESSSDTSPPQLTTYILDLNHQVIHENNCEKLLNASAVREEASMELLLGRGNKPCICCIESYRQTLRKRNRDIIARSEYSFVYSPDSKIFHTRCCDRILAAEKIQGTVKYITCLGTGRSPCKVCKPTVADESYRYLKQVDTPKAKRHKSFAKSGIPVVMPPKPETKPKPKKPYGRVLTIQEQRAMQRFISAKSEREAVLKNSSLTPEQKADAITLTQPSYAFWASSGFGNFHLRHCGRLKTLTDLKGFSLYEDAVRAGYKPCRQCKPSPKHNLEISMPIYSKERPTESVEVLIKLCQENGFSSERQRNAVLVETTKGIWRVHTGAIPYKLEHINKIYGANNRTEFHTQPKIFLSLTDVFIYIKKHDSCTAEVYNENIEQR